MGIGQNLLILIPVNDKNPLPLPFPQKKAQGLMFFDFLRPNDCLKIRELPCHVNGFSNFFQLFLHPSLQAQNPFGKNLRLSLGYLRERRHNHWPPFSGAAFVDLLLDLRSRRGIRFVLGRDVPIGRPDYFHRDMMASKTSIFIGDFRAVGRFAPRH